MAFHGLTFPNQNVSALDDRAFYRSFRGDGVIQGCGISFTNNSITIQAGWLIACGGLVQIDGATTINFDEIPTSGYGRVMLQIDTSQASTVEDFAQLSYLVDYSASIDGFTAPVQEDINLGTGTIYQIVMAIVQISGGNLTNINEVLVPSFLFSTNAILRGNTGGVQYVNPAIEFFVGDRPVGRIASITGANDIRMYGENSDRSAGGGVVFAPDGVCILHGDGSNPIRFRPYGAYVNTYEVGVSIDGKIYGAFPKISASGNKAVAANTVTDICSITVTKGQWLIIGAFYGNSGSTGTIISYLRSTSLGSYKITRSTNVGGGAATNGLIQNFPNASETVSLSVYSPTAQTIQGFIYASRLE